MVHTNPGVDFTDLSEECLLIGQLVLQFVIDVMHRGGFSLGTQVTFLQRDNPFLHVFFLTHGLYRDTQKKDLI